MSTMQMQNPYPVRKYEGDSHHDNPIIGWRWYDETWQESEKLYPDQLSALQDMLKYIHFLNHGPTWWQRLWWPVRYKLWPKLVAFWKDTSSGGRRDDGGVR